MLDRTTCPAIKPFGKIIFPEPEIIRLENGIPLYILRGGDQEVNRMDIIYSAGRFNQEKPLAAELCNLMLKEGAGSLNSQEIAERLDFYGAWLQPSVTTHNSYITLFSLNKYFEPSLDVVARMILSPEFPEKEFRIQTSRKKRQHQIEQEKVATLAANGFVRLLFGEEHPYGSSVKERDFDRINTDDLKDFFYSFYRPEQCKMVITGKVTDEMIKQINRFLGQNTSNNMPTPLRLYPIKRAAKRMVFSEKADAIQTAIRVGLPLVTRDHPDYLDLRILNTFLGGYFGSRLMSNIRQDKGYTYGIGSSVVTLPQATYLAISTQTGTEYTKALIDEIFIETERLQNEPIQEEEMEMVRNYSLGELARLIDTPLALASAFVPLVVNGLTFDYYQAQQDSIQTITAKRLQELAQKYFNREDFFISIAGPQNPF